MTVTSMCGQPSAYFRIVKHDLHYLDELDLVLARVFQGFEYVKLI